jgi:hypothetical protein
VSPPVQVTIRPASIIGASAVERQCGGGSYTLQLM